MLSWISHFSSLLPTRHCFPKTFQFQLKKDSNLCGISMAIKQAVSYPSLSPCIHKYDLSPAYKYMLATSSYTADLIPCYDLGNTEVHNLYILWSHRIVNWGKVMQNLPHVQLCHLCFARAGILWLCTLCQVVTDRKRGQFVQNDIWI